MPRREVGKKKDLLGGLVPSRGSLNHSAIAKARIQKAGMRISVPENAKAAKKEGGKGEVAFSLFGALKGLFGFLNDKIDARIPIFDEKKGNVKLATNKTTNVTVADNKNTVNLEVRGKKTTLQVNERSPMEI